MKNKLLIGGAVFVLIIVAALFLLVSNINTIVKKGVETAGPEILKAPVSLSKVNISISSGAGELLGFTIGNPAGFNTAYAFQMDRIRVELDPTSVTTDKIHIKSIVIDGPKVNYEGTFGKSNISVLQNNAKSFAGTSSTKTTASQDKQPSDGAGKTVVIDNVKITNGSISVSMAGLQGQQLTIPLPDLQLKDIGKDKKATFSDALGEVLGAINKSAIPAVQSGVTGLTKGLQDTGNVLKDEAQKGVDSIKGLFGK